MPATAAARRRRGFDHAEHLARELSFIAGLDFAPLLVAARRTSFLVAKGDNYDR